MLSHRASYLCAQNKSTTQKLHINRLMHAVRSAHTYLHLHQLFSRLQCAHVQVSISPVATLPYQGSASVIPTALWLASPAVPLCEQTEPQLHIDVALTEHTCGTQTHTHARAHATHIRIISINKCTRYIAPDEDTRGQEPGLTCEEWPLIVSIQGD
eukprot:COSAG02_NODE_93_length_37477_cov_78.101129_18_plen_156_part_00